MVAGIDQWGITTPDLHEPRLEKELGVDGFVLPPEAGSGVKIPVVRFPRWYSCAGCNRLEEHSRVSSFADNRCNSCGALLIPSRFVMACRRGHIDDFPYFRWLHHGQPGDASHHSLTIKAGGNTASLRDIVISCTCGVPARSMEGAFAKFALPQVTKCTGRRPWIDSTERIECGEPPRTLQRGASNVWFPVLHSALSIPPWSEGAFKAINRHWLALKWAEPDEALAGILRGMKLALGTPFTVDDLVAAVKQRRARESGSIVSESSLKGEEYEALSRGAPERPDRGDFVCVPVPSIGPTAAKWFEQVSVVKRLREVRAISTFSRLMPPSAGDPGEYRARLFDVDPGWLPAVDVSGEGVFLRFRTESLREWESLPGVIKRANILDGHYRDRFRSHGIKPDRQITPRFAMAHTFAHSLINQFSLDSGYPASALRERIYVSNEMAGILIYTASSDSAGSLGGIVAQAVPHRLDASLTAAIERVAWCSADPLCMEADAVGVDSLNLAACHACVLLPEVSCEEMNVLLDRALLVGSPGQAMVGFFSGATN
jgi:Domain of unknown function (DUF1998)